MNKQNHLQNIKARVFIILTLITAVFGLLSTVDAQVIRPQLVSAANGGYNLPNARTREYDSSADGRFVVFESAATNLVPGLIKGNTNGSDIFLRDTKTNQTRCLSMNSARTATGNSSSYKPIITPDGAYVVFASDASDLVSNDTNGKLDVFRVHTGTGEIQMVSRNRTNQNGGDETSYITDGVLRSYDISSDGRYVVFVSLASDLLPEPFLDNNGKSDIFVRDMTNGTTRCASFSTTFASTANDHSTDPSISADGQRVSFMSLASNLYDNQMDSSGSTNDIFVRNMPNMEIRCVSRGFGAIRNLALGGQGASMSKNGARITFLSISAEISPIDNSNTNIDVFVYDYGLDTNFLVSINPSGTSSGNANSGEAQFPSDYSLNITPDGRYIVFESRATNLVTNISDSANTPDVFRRDLLTGETKMVSVSRNQALAGNSNSVIGMRRSSISDDGRFIAFHSQAINLIAEPSAAAYFHPYVRDMNNGITFAGDFSLDGNGLGNNPSEKPVITADGKKVLFASFANNLAPNDSNSTGDLFSARVPVPQQTVSDFDGDNRTDFAVFRPSIGTWYSLPANGFVNIRNWGLASDKIVPADYDGDGKTDHAVFRASESTWYIQRSTGIFTETVQFGVAGDVPAPADYDGDGRADIAVFRPSNGTWYIRQTTDGEVRFQNFGLNGDVPVAGDFDGDSKADIAVFRPSESVWYILRSSNNSFVSVQFGVNSDRLVPADYDGDGKTDIAVYRASEALWYIFESRTNEIKYINFGLSTDTPTPGDYDGDGRADIAVFRPSSGDWYVLRSSNGALSGSNWGMSTDIPVPAAYIP